MPNSTADPTFQPGSEHLLNSSENPDSASTKPTLCIINYNGAQILPEPLAAAMAQKDWFAEIILVDNGSDDGSVQFVNRAFPDIRVICLPNNRGAGAARNVGLREASTDLILFVDNDVSVAPGCVAHLVNALAQQPRAVVATPSVLYARKSDVIQYDGADSHYLGQMKLHNEDLPLSASDPRVRRIGSIVTACFLVDRSRLRDADGFDESFFYMFEDHDFGMRLRALGHEILSVPAAHCLHGEGAQGLSIRRIGKYSRVRIYYLIRNRWLIILKIYSLRSLFILSPMFLFYEVAQLIIAIKKGWFVEWCRALAWIATHLPGILAKRHEIQRRRVTPDRVLLVGGPIPFRGELTTSRIERAARRALDAIAIAYWDRARQYI